MNFYEYKSYKSILRPVWELKRWREAQAQPRPAQIWHIMAFIGAILVLTTVFLIRGCQTPAMAQEPIIAGYSLDSWVYAIGRAECGETLKHCKYYYGIRSVHYEDFQEAKRICANTVSHNWRRFEKAGLRGHTQFIVYLQQKYCPNTQRYPRQSEIWVRNVKYYLKHTKRS